MKTQLSDSKYVPLITAASILVPAVVAILLFVPKKELEGQLDVGFLPTLNAVINSTVSVLLVAGFLFIRKKKVKQHKAMMLSALALSSLFLISYVVYHTFAESTKFGGEGSIRYVYFFILISHILLATTVLPLALFSTYRGLKGEIARHRKIAKWTFPIWLYVSVTGVVVYLMISPYYSH